MDVENGSVSHEDNFRELIRKADVDVDLDAVVSSAKLAFEEVAGFTDGAMAVWNTKTLPDALKVYRSTPLKLGRKLLEIIEETAEQKGAEAAVSYLNSAIPKEEVEFCESDRKMHSEKLVADIENLIAEYAAKYGENYGGVVAIVIWGSYARFEQRLDSDIDYSPIVMDDLMGFPNGDVWVHTDDFEDLMAVRLDAARGYAVDMQSWAIAAITDEESIRSMIEIETPEFLVASPFPEVKEKVKRVLEEEIAKVT